MTNSRSNTSRSNWFVLFAVLVAFSGSAFAGKKKIVVLDFKGPDAQQFHDDVVKLVDKDHKIVNTDKWTGAAEEADAKKFSTKNVKKVAKKVKVDGVIWGRVEKDGDGYTLELKLRAGKTGELVGEKIEVKLDSAELKGKAKKKVREALIPEIEGLEELGSGGDEPVAVADVVKEDKPEKTEKTEKTDKTDKTETAEATEETGRHHKKKKHNASSDDDTTKTEEQVDEPVHVMSADEALLPANRAVDFTIGLSFVARRLSFSFDGDLADQPSGYKQTVPVAGGIMDAVVYPMAFSHKNSGIITGLGIEVMYDKVIKINSQKKYVDDMMAAATANLSTVEDRFSIGAVLRYPVSPSLLVGGKLLYSSQQFNIQQSFAGNMATDVPNVHYSMAEPKVFLKYSIGGPIMINLDAGFMLVTSTGGIQSSSNAGYGPATVTGYEASAGLDYTLTKNLFIRALARFETVSLSFKGDAASLANTRDTDPMQDVQGAKDLYFGGSATIGYAF
ncbi:MAG: hypothetical protein ABI678_06570 [Kofleriaceae bacterium]